MAKILILLFLPLFSVEVIAPAWCLKENDSPLTKGQIEALALKGIHLTMSSTFNPSEPKNMKNGFQGGVQHISDFEQKIPLFFKWGKKYLFKPEKTILLDDS